MANKSNNIVRLLTLGDTGAGKSSLLLRFTQNEFTHEYMPTIGIDFRLKNVTVDGKEVKVQVWDTAGQERFRTITHNYYRGAHGIALVYDVTSTASFDNIKTWIAGVHKYADQDVAMALIGNKCDMTSSRAVSREEGQVLADHHGIAFFETSAKASINVDDAFNYLIRKVCDRLFSADGAAAGGAAGRSGAAAGQQQQQGQTVNLAESSNAKPEKSGSCC